MYLNPKHVCFRQRNQQPIGCLLGKMQCRLQYLKGPPKFCKKNEYFSREMKWAIPYAIILLRSNINHNQRTHYSAQHYTAILYWGLGAELSPALEERSQERLKINIPPPASPLAAASTLWSKGCHRILWKCPCIEVEKMRNSAAALHIIKNIVITKTTYWYEIVSGEGLVSFQMKMFPSFPVLARRSVPASSASELALPSSSYWRKI